MKQDNGATDVTIGGTGAGTDGLPAGITADAIRDAEAIFDGLAPASRRAYAGHVRRFAAFAEARGLRGPDALRGRVLADYVRAIHSAGSSPATVRQAAAAVRKLATALDRPIQGRAGALVLAAIQSASRDGRDRGRGSAAAADWARAEAAAILAASSRDVSGLRDAALVRVASDCLLRVGEVSALRVGDVSKNRDGSGRVVVRFSKTDQDGDVATLYAGPPTVRAVRAYLRAAGHSDDSDGPLFRSTRGRSAGRSLSARSVRAVISRRLRNAGAKGRVSGHSLRRGSAAELVERGAGLAEVQIAGRWKDPRQVQRYAADGLAGRGAVARIRYGAAGR